MNALAGITALLADPFVSDILAGRRDGMLLLDYDGTLAPFVQKRDEARPYAGVVDILARLPVRGPGRFVVVTGRTASELVSFLAPARPMEIWGCHGAERLAAGHAAGRPDVPPREAQALAQALELAQMMAPPESLEQKPVSLALHWRGLGEAARHTLEHDIGAAWAGLARDCELTLHTFDGGLELRLPGMDKGRAVHALRRENPGTSLLYFGDDLTDEDAFKALGPTDVGVLVRSEARPSAATYRITPPGELLQFLARWANTAQIGEPQPRNTHARD